MQHLDWHITPVSHNSSIVPICYCLVRINQQLTPLFPLSSFSPSCPARDQKGYASGPSSSLTRMTQELRTAVTHSTAKRLGCPANEAETENDKKKHLFAKKILKAKKNEGLVSFAWPLFWWLYTGNTLVIFYHIVNKHAALSYGIFMQKRILREKKVLRARARGETFTAWNRAVIFVRMKEREKVRLHKAFVVLLFFTKKEKEKENIEQKGLERREYKKRARERNRNNEKKK